jgi:spermidine/putrescine transport system ATP-binding protein
LEEKTGSNMNIIELKSITKQFEDGFKAVEDVNLEVKRGEFVTFLGPSGCGKTTTLRMIAGFEIPTEGQILLDGEDISKLPPYERPINTVFQRYALFPHLNIFDNIAFGLKLKKLPKAEIKKKVRRVLEMVDLEGFETRKVSTLSGGQQQRIAIARALVNEPEILLLDEPLGALDLKMRKEMQLELKSMHERLGITFIYVTHDQEEALTMSDKIVVMSEGRIQQIGTPEDIYNEPKNAFVADFIGDSNIFNGIMTGKLKVRFCGAEFTCLDDVPDGTHIDAVVRPEDVIITSEDEGAIKGVVTSVIFKGVHYEIAVESGKNEIVIQSTKSAKVGDRVGLNIEPDGIHIMIAEHTLNKIESDIVYDRDYRLDLFDGKIACDISKLISGSRINEDGVLVDENGDEIDTDKLKVIVAVKPTDITMSDEKNAGVINGRIINLIYKGDHYSYVVRTDIDEDFIVSDEYLWNMDDRVSLIIPEDKVTFTLKK